MKRIFSFLVLAVLCTSCDDGDLQEVSFEFNDSSAIACNISGEDEDFFIYKTTDQRALILQLSEKNFSNTITADTLSGVPIGFDLGLRNKLIYRVYSDNVSADNICSAIPPSLPIVTEERIASDGKVSITTTALKTFNETDGSSKIAQYRHTISFSDITFNVADGSQRNESLPTIIYDRSARSFAAFDGPTELNSCSDNPKLLYRNNNDQSLLLRLNDETVATLFSHTEGVKKAYFTNAQGTENSLTHLFYGSTATNPLNEAYFCNPVTPNYPTVQESWKAANGVVDESGIIEVLTEEINNGFKHTITLRNVTMEKGTQDFTLKSTFVLGIFTETTP